MKFNSGESATFDTIHTRIKIKIWPRPIKVNLGDETIREILTALGLADKIDELIIAQKLSGIVK